MHLNMPFHFRLRENKILRILFISNGLFLMGSALLGPLYAIYVEGIQKGILPVTLSATVFILSSTVFSVFVSAFGDRIKSKEKLFIAGLFLRGIPWLGYAFVQNLPQLLALQILLGFGEALGTPAYDVLVAEHLDRGGKIKDYADWKILANVLNSVGTLLGGAIVSLYGFTPVFYIMFFITTVSALIAYFGLSKK
jgi:MFS family permease